MSGHAITKKKVIRRTPKGQKTILLKRKEKVKPECHICKSKLHGAIYERSPAKIHRKSKTQRRPNSIFGGVLCPKCREKVIIDASLIKLKQKNIEDVSNKERYFIESVLRRLSK
ncbi:MAG: hypothetical protein N3D73_02690 [Candidatus Diapherotrites archaeon]|nr:hypothetical protein [Candidatus Diapherotrites archaeon]